MDHLNKKVIEHLLARKEGKDDNRKIGLIIQGGGMRGAFSGGVMIKLQELGLADAFDVIYASSSGVCCGAYLLSHQAKTGTSIFYEDLTGFKFIQPWRVHKMMNLDYFCDVVMRQKKVLNVDRVKKSETTLKIFVTDSCTGRCSHFTNHDDVDLIESIKASCSYPGFYHEVEINGKKYLDGYIRRALPIDDAIKDGCTDILIVTVVPENYKHAENKIQTFLEDLLLLPLNKAFRRAFNKRFSEENRALCEAFNKVAIDEQVNITTIKPPYLISNSETKGTVLKKFARQGQLSTEEAFNSAVRTKV